MAATNQIYARRVRLIARSMTGVRQISLLESINKNAVGWKPQRQHQAAASTSALRDNLPASNQLSGFKRPSLQKLPESAYGGTIQDLDDS